MKNIFYSQTDHKPHLMGDCGDTPSCNCALCEMLRELGPYHPTGGWCDPRRYYEEGNDANFLQRIPDGFIKWPEDHVSFWDVPLEQHG